MPSRCNCSAEAQIQANTHRRSTRSTWTVCALLFVGTLVGGCRTASREPQAGSDLRPFDAAAVAKLSHEAYKVAWDARFWAARDLRFAAFRPTANDWETVEYLRQISQHVPSISRTIEKNPATPRASSKRSNDFVQHDALILRTRYQPTSFRKSTNDKIEKLIRILNDIASYYGEG